MRRPALTPSSTLRSGFGWILPRSLPSIDREREHPRGWLAEAAEIASLSASVSAEGDEPGEAGEHLPVHARDREHGGYRPTDRESQVVTEPIERRHQNETALPETRCRILQDTLRQRDLLDRRRDAGKRIGILGVEELRARRDDDRRAARLSYGVD